MKYSILKLRTNEYVIGEIIKESEKGIDMKDVLSINYRYDEQGYPVLYFAKYSLFTNSYDVFFSRQDIMHVFRDPVLSIVKYYEMNVERIQSVNRDEIPIDMPDEDDDFLSLFDFGDHSIN